MRNGNFQNVPRGTMKGVINLIVVNARYFPQMGVHMLNGFTTNKTYTAAYNEVITEISKFASAADVESISLIKCIDSNVEGLNYGGYYVTAKIKE